MPAKVLITLGAFGNTSATKHIQDDFRDLAKLTAYLGVRIKMNGAILVSFVLTLVQKIS